VGNSRLSGFSRLRVQAVQISRRPDAGLASLGHAVWDAHSPEAVARKEEARVAASPVMNLGDQVQMPQLVLRHDPVMPGRPDLQRTPLDSQKIAQIPQQVLQKQLRWAIDIALSACAPREGPQDDLALRSSPGVLD